MEKFAFVKTEVSYLGFIPTPNCFKPEKDKLKAVEHTNFLKS
jgi:hypothetical protein